MSPAARPLSTISKGIEIGRGVRSRKLQLLLLSGGKELECCNLDLGICWTSGASKHREPLDFEGKSATPSHEMAEQVQKQRHLA